MKNTLFASASIAALLAVVPSTNAATVHFTASGVQPLGNSELWGASNITGNSTAFELLFDFTATTDAITQAIPLLEGGGNGIGMSVVLDNNNLHFWAGNNLSFVFSTAHGLTAPQNDLQLVATITYDTSGALDTYEMYINGVSLGTKSDTDMNNDWAGGDGGTGLGQEGGTQRYDNTTLFDSGNMAVFTDGDDDDITVNIYDQTLPDYDLNDILVPEPSAAMLSGLGLLARVLRSRR